MKEVTTSVVTPDIIRVTGAPATLVITLVIVVILAKDLEKVATRAIATTGATTKRKIIFQVQNKLDEF